jgi:hypothetical protein
MSPGSEHIPKKAGDFFEDVGVVDEQLFRPSAWIPN